MKRNTITSALVAAALLLSVGLSLAAEGEHWRTGETKTIDKAKTPEKNGRATGAKSAAKVKLVDINSAGKTELKTLPGVGDAEADKIIAGRPYLSKANLTTRNIVSREVYESLKARVIARQKANSPAKPGKK